MFLTAELWLRLSQGHPLTYDIHGVRLILSLGCSPSAPADKTDYSTNSMQTPQLCFVTNILQLHQINIRYLIKMIWDFGLHLGDSEFFSQNFFFFYMLVQRKPSENLSLLFSLCITTSGLHCLHSAARTA